MVHRGRKAEAPKLIEGLMWDLPLVAASTGPRGIGIIKYSSDAIGRYTTRATRAVNGR